MLFRGVPTVNFRFDRNGNVTVGNHRIKFKYNDQGIRTEKTVNGITTKYNLVGGSVTYEDNGKDKIHYTYDSSGKLISMNLNRAEYYYVRNAQGDIIGLIDAQGEKVVSYTYDFWGKLIFIEGSLKDTVGEKNPYRIGMTVRQGYITCRIDTIIQNGVDLSMQILVKCQLLMERP